MVTVDRLVLMEMETRVIVRSTVCVGPGETLTTVLVGPGTVRVTGTRFVKVTVFRIVE